MKGINGLIKEFGRSMEAAAYAEEGEFKTAKAIMAEGQEEVKKNMKHTDGHGTPMVLKPTAVSR